MKLILYIAPLLLTLLFCENASAQDCYTIDRSRPEWMRKDTVSAAQKGRLLPLYSFAIVPNPVDSKSAIECEIQRTTQLSINIIDNNGRMIKPIYNDFMHPGRHLIEFDTRTSENVLAAGVYYISIESAHKRLRTLKLIIR